MTKQEKFNPKIIQLEDYMKEIVSSSGKNAFNILFPNGMKELNITDSNDKVNNGEVKPEEKKEE